MDHFKVAIVTNIRMRLKFKVARTPQFAIQRIFIILPFLIRMRNFLNRRTANCGVLATSNFKRMRIFVTMGTSNDPKLTNFVSTGILKSYYHPKQLCDYLEC